MKKLIIGTAAAAALTLSVSAPAMAEGNGYGKTFTQACGSTWGEIVSNGQPRSEGSAHYRSGYKGGVQGIVNNPEALAFHAAALCG
jgi:hypothetical protein